MKKTMTLGIFHADSFLNNQKMENSAGWEIYVFSMLGAILPIKFWSELIFEEFATFKFSLKQKVSVELITVRSSH